MTKEIELKFQTDNLTVVRLLLKRLGAKLLWKGAEENWFFDTKNRALQKRDSALRIKQMGDYKLTLKEGQKEVRGIKVATEYQIPISDLKTTRELLGKLGYHEVFAYAKKREHWKLGGALIEVDTLARGAYYVEIEGTPKKIKELADKLGLDFKKSTTATYFDLIKNLGKKHS